MYDTQSGRTGCSLWNFTGQRFARGLHAAEFRRARRARVHEDATTGDRLLLGVRGRALNGREALPHGDKGLRSVGHWAGEIASEPLDVISEKAVRKIYAPICSAIRPNGDFRANAKDDPGFGQKVGRFLLSLDCTSR